MVDVAEIRIWNQFVGAVRWDEQQGLAYFEYDKNFVKLGWDLSPIKMPVAQGAKIYSFPELRQQRQMAENTFKALPGLLSDVLPDRYGNTLLNAWLARQGRAENSMNPVEMLCFIGNRGMGALEFEPAQTSGGKRANSLELEELVSVAKMVLQQRKNFSTTLSKDEEKAMREILKIGTSAGGARPKAVIGFNPKTLAIKSGQGDLPQDFEHWLIKLDGVSSEQFGSSTGWGRVEYAYYLMALDCNIEMMESRLLEENSRAHFITKRFDRTGNTKHHIQSFCGIQHYDFNDMMAYSYEQLFQTMRLLQLTYPEAEQLYRRMVFNVIATNYDDHTKNFSFMLKHQQHWQLAPAYDICFANDPDNYWVNQQTLSVNGKRRHISKSDLLKIADENNIKRANQIIEQINDVVSHWQVYAKKAGVKKSLTQHIQKHLAIFT